jgi:heptosyltransferase-3
VDLNNKTVIISRTDSIGDVMLTLPICAWLKEQSPDVKIIFLGKGYTKSIVEAYDLVDQFEDWNDYINVPKTNKIQSFRKLNADVIIHVFPDKEIASLAKKARVGIRIGTSHKAYHLLTCSHRVNFTRRKSNFHEAQLNHELLRPLHFTKLKKRLLILKWIKLNYQPRSKTSKTLQSYTQNRKEVPKNGLWKSIWNWPPRLLRKENKLFLLEQKMRENSLEKVFQ